MLDKIIRTVVVYWALIVLLRLAGKRDLAQLNSFDLIVMLLLSNVVQNAIIGPDNSLLGGLIGAATLIAANAFLVRVVRPNKLVTAFLEGTNTVLARNGRWLPDGCDGWACGRATWTERCAGRTSTRSPTSTR